MERRLSQLLVSQRAHLVGWVALVALVALGLRYADFAANQRQGFLWCLENSETCRGREIRLPVWDVVEVGEDRYAVFKATGPIPIQGSTEDLQVGDTVSVLGTFDPESASILEVTRHVHRKRPLKKALSGLGLMLFFAGIPWCLRLRNRRLEYRG